jgi:hypothetical protein
MILNEVVLRFITPYRNLQVSAQKTGKPFKIVKRKSSQVLRLGLGRSIKVLEVGEVIKLEAKRIKFGE